MTEIGEKHPRACYYPSFPPCQYLVRDRSRKHHDSSHETSDSLSTQSDSASSETLQAAIQDSWCRSHVVHSSIFFPWFWTTSQNISTAQKHIPLCSTWKAMRSGAAVYSQHHTRSVWTMVTSNHTIATKRADISQESVLDDLHQALLPKLSAIDGLWTTFKASSFQASPQGDQCKLRCLTIWLYNIPSLKIWI